MPYIKTLVVHQIVSSVTTKVHSFLMWLFIITLEGLEKISNIQNMNN